MKKIELIQQRLLDADGVPGVLSVGWEVFEFFGAVAATMADQSADMYPAFMFTRGAAMSGRNAIAFAPSTPAGHAPLMDDPAEFMDGNVYQHAADMAGLATILSARLREAEELAADPGDQAACKNAARDAKQISELLARGE